MESNSITFAIQCHYFQKRLCFMLSSLKEQNSHGFEKVVLDISHMKENGTPTTEATIDMFRKQGLEIVDRVYEDIDKFQYRGLTRNDQLNQCTTQYLVFVDTDMVYHPKFLRRLYRTLNNDDMFKDYSGIMTCGRFSQPNEKISITNELVDSLIQDEAKVIEGAWNHADSLEKKKRGNVGAGFWQLIDVTKCPHDNLYVDPDKCNDWGWTNKYQKANSDKQFRRRIGDTRKLPSWFSRAQIHLNHFRDNEVGFHLEDQR